MSLIILLTGHKTVIEIVQEEQYVEKHAFHERKLSAERFAHSLSKTK